MIVSLMGLDVETGKDKIKMGKLIIDGNSVYEIDEACQRKKEEEQRKERKEEQERKVNHNRHRF